MPFLNLEDVELRELIPGFNVRFVHTENMTFAFWQIEPGSALPEHSHPHEQVAQMIEGEFELTVNNEAKVLTPGTIAVVPPNAPHSGKAITACRILDVFYPVREDYR
ncbi:cupin domain-containing protein [Thermodesulfobacteriota bacterium]